MSDSIRELRHRLATASRVTVLTGAGVSAASGVPTFRGQHGLWRTHRAEDLATPEAFARNPTLVWEWYDWRRTLMAACRPNAAHEVLARWTHERDVTLITQNVDGLHELAGSRDVVRFHGSIWMLRCAGGCGRPEWEDRTAPLPALPPRCPSCGGLARPAVTWFGEIIDAGVLLRCAEAVDCDLFLSVGTSAIVYPAAGLLHEAHRRGAFTVEINPNATDASDLVDLAVAMPAEEALAGM
jgi:NAD-dependent deacetylase